MAKTRLNVSKRDRLNKFMKEHTDCPKEKKAMKADMERVVKLVTPLIQKKWPAEDMAVLDKYNRAQKICAIQGQCAETSRYIKIDLCKKTEFLEPSGHNSSRAFVFPKPVMNAWDKFEKSRDAYKKARNELRLAYQTLIYNARTFEDVVEVWPAAERLRSEICAQTTAVSVLSNEAIAAIKKHNAGADAQIAA